ncbi:hypothetical protein Pan216_12790 [Planctomycetes bacterium Pan216]|uniref:GYF domain-containing protein n=1 Tax=Kolteria novifilia TaxID=2527975 RepID=A0A518B0E1_9BACT|nr:hypothetical protein Pan216_12790 [Planctomycetes bacterium Pan216]
MSSTRTSNSDDKRWMYRDVSLGINVGPYTPKQIRQAVIDRIITKDTPISPNGSKWVSAGEVDQLKPYFGGIPATNADEPPTIRTPPLLDNLSRLNYILCIVGAFCGLIGAVFCAANVSLALAISLTISTGTFCLLTASMGAGLSYIGLTYAHVRTLSLG